MGDQKFWSAIFIENSHKENYWSSDMDVCSSWQMASSSGVSATSPLGPAGSNSTMVLTSTTPGTGSVLSLPVGKHYIITLHAYLMSVDPCILV